MSVYEEMLLIKLIYRFSARSQSGLISLLDTSISSGFYYLTFTIYIYHYHEFFLIVSLTHHFNFSCGRKLEEPEKARYFRQRVDELNFACDQTSDPIEVWAAQGTREELGWK